jgi:hypothetical protein
MATPLFIFMTLFFGAQTIVIVQQWCTQDTEEVEGFQSLDGCDCCLERVKECTK